MIGARLVRWLPFGVGKAPQTIAEHRIAFGVCPVNFNRTQEADLKKLKCKEQLRIVRGRRA